MSELIDILHYSLGSLFWGFLIGAVCLSLFFFLIKGWYKNAIFTPASYIVGTILGVLLIVQSTLACGAFAIKGAANSYEATLTAIVDDAYGVANLAMDVTPEESDQFCRELIDQNPLLGHYIGGAEFSGFTARQLPHAMIKELNRVMNWYIVRRALWSLGFVIVAAFIVIKTLDRQNSRRSYRRTTERTGRSRQQRVRPRYR